MYQVTNAAYIAKAETLKKKKSLIGDNPCFFKLQWMESLEITKLNELHSYSFLLEHIIKNQ